MKKFIVIAVLLIAVSAVFGAVLVTEEQAVKDMLPGGGKAVKAPCSDADKAEIKKLFKGDVMEGSVIGKECVFYVGKEGVASVQDHKGKWGDIKAMVLIGQDGKIKNLEIMSSSEKRGRPIVMRSFLDQFIGRGISDNLEVFKNVNAVSGATISSVAVTKMVNRALGAHKILYPKAK